MKYGVLVAACLCACIAAVSCKAKKEMTIDDYAKIELEVNLPDPELDRAKVEAVVRKYGYTYEQFKAMHDKVEKDPSLKEQIGERRMKEQIKGQE